MTAGAVVSGAYFGDKMSPLSDTTNLAPAMAGATLFDHIKHMIYTTGVSMIIALVAYAVMGFMYASDNEVDMSVVQEITEFIEGSTNISVWALIPPLFVILMVAFKLPAIPGLIGGVLIGIPFMFLNQAHVEAAMERAGDLPLGSGLINNIFYILNNGIAMGNVPEGASDIINELSGSADGQRHAGIHVDHIHHNLRHVLRRRNGRHRNDGFTGRNFAEDCQGNRRTGPCNRDHLSRSKRGMLRPVSGPRTAGQDVQGSFRRQKACTEEPVKVSGGLRNHNIELLPLEHLRSYHEAVPRSEQRIHPVCHP